MCYSCRCDVRLQCKRVICKTWTGTFEILANSAGPDQTAQNAAPYQSLHCLLRLQEVKGQMKQSCVLVQDYFSTLHSETIHSPVLSMLRLKVSNAG